MMSEYWGTLSVRDHLDTQAIVADLLLYDRLVFPVMSGDGERTRWRDEGWDPEKQELLIERLGDDTAVRALWDQDAQRRWSDLRRARNAIEFDAYQVSRMVFAMGKDYDIPKGVAVRAIAAYHDEREAKRDLQLQKPGCDPGTLGKLAYVVGRDLLVPSIDPRTDGLDLVQRARDLAQQRSFRAERAEFYNWLENKVNDIAQGRGTVDGAVSELKKRADALNHPIRAYFAEHRKGIIIKSAFTVVGLALPHALGLPEATGAIGAIPHVFELLKFATEEVVDAGGETKIEAAGVVVSANKLQRKPLLGRLFPGV